VTPTNSQESAVLSSDAQKVLKFTDKLATTSLFNRTAGRGCIINKELYPLEREEIQAYLKADRKTFERIRYHFSIPIKDDTAEYELFFDVVAN
jgi:hypothetical protein